MSLFPATVEVCRMLPPDSLVRRLRPQRGHIVIRPYSPAGERTSGIITQQHSKWPKVLAHVLAIGAEDLDVYPHLVPGSLVLIRRFSDEELGDDAPRLERWIGQRLPIAIVNIKAIDALIGDLDISLEI